ncbi:hypothetical protein [Aquitalea sp. LB_tupeE]|uniref:hypothetical protein n=1 Tax=Aquitalea sp. LB_tupeE TaxID=2748078 RepID=UPI0015BE78D9|nr:hypothetical protein [Aquitalea sp. LB_tupeE]NWK80257.1 hypothetical protein [Aquitalea sp. LB_tupeE]
MYNINDLFEMVRYSVGAMMKCVPYVLIHFVALIMLRGFLLRFCHDRAVLRGSLFFSFPQSVYRYSLLVLMLFLSWIVSVLLYLRVGISFYFAGDFLFVAGVLLGWRRGWSILLINLLIITLWFYYIERSGLIILYLILDAVIYFMVGIFSGNQHDFMDGVYGLNDIFLVCVNKLVAALISAACWVLLTQESWFVGVNLLIFRLVGWPLASLPMIFLVLYLMRQDARKLVLQPA